jgi:hypothetical protein
MPITRTRQQGYGLIIVAALFTAFALIAAAVIDRNTVATQLDQQQALRTQLTRLNVALMKYAYNHGSRFPCPARYDLTFLDNNFGTPAAISCYSGSAPSGTRLLSGTFNANKLLQGMVPVKALVPYGISINDAFDPWGGRIMMAVTRDLTPGAAGGTIDERDRPQVTEVNTNQLLRPAPDLVLVSFGADRAGAFLRSQTNFSGPAIACPSSSERRGVNCNTDNIFTLSPLNMASSVGAANYFDDMIGMLRYNGASSSTNNCVDQCGTTRSNGASWCGALGAYEQAYRCTNGSIEPGSVAGCGVPDAAPSC